VFCAVIMVVAVIIRAVMTHSFFFIVEVLFMGPFSLHD